MDHDLIIGVIAVIVLTMLANSKYKTHTKQKKSMENVKWLNTKRTLNNMFPSN